MEQVFSRFSLRQFTPWICSGVALLAVGGLYLYFQQTVGWEQITQISTLQGHIENYGVWGPLLYILLLMVAVVVSQIPNVPLAIASSMPPSLFCLPLSWWSVFSSFPYCFDDTIFGGCERGFALNRKKQKKCLTLPSRVDVRMK